MIPDDVLPHFVDVVNPGTTTDRYENEVEDWSPGAATRQQVSAWMQQSSGAGPAGSEVTDQRNAQIGEWLLICNPYDIDGQPLGITGRSRIEWQSLTFEVIGPAGPAFEPTGLHHYEVRLRTVEG